MNDDTHGLGVKVIIVPQVPISHKVLVGSLVQIFRTNTCYSFTTCILEHKSYL